MLVPLTFPASLHLTGQPDSCSNAAERNFWEETSTRLIAWQVESSSGPLGAAVGGELGSIYLFGTPLPGEDIATPGLQSLPRTRSPTPTITLPPAPRASSPPSSPPPPRSPSHSRRHSRSLHSPSSLSLNQALMGPSARSRVVSGVSHEQVQAPKNFVDFDDEPDRLKDLLKGNAVNKNRERGLVDALLPSFDKGVVIERSPQISPSSFLPSSTLTPSNSGVSKGRDGPNSLLSATASPILTPRSISAPSSPRLVSPSTDKINEDALTLFAHVVPTRCGVGHGISDIVYPEGTGLLVALQESGELTAINVRDGVCAATAQCGNSSQLRDNIWRWTRLRVVQIEEKSYLILACASSRPPYAPIFGLPYSVDEIPKKNAKFTLFEFRIGDPYGVHPPSLERLGDWRVDGHAEASDLLRNDVDGSLLFIYVSSEHHVVSQAVTVVAGYEVRTRARSLTSSSTHSHDEPRSLTIPNPFKTFGSKSSENIVSTDSHLHVEETIPENHTPSADLSRLRFGQEYDVSLVMFSSIPKRLGGLRAKFVVSSDRLLVVVWTDSEALGFHLRDNGTSLSGSFTLPTDVFGKIWDVQLVDSETLVVLGTTARWYTLLQVDGNGDSIGASEDAILQPVLTHTTSLGTTTAVSSISGTQELLALRRTSAGRKELFVLASSTPPTSREAIRHRLWRTRPVAIPHEQTEPFLTSVLLIELTLLVLGYSDGHVRHTSFSALASAGRYAPPSHSSSSAGDAMEGSFFHRTSDISVSAPVQSLHLIRNERTGERFIVGGSDDGGIAVWTLQGLKLCARFIQFIVPLFCVVQVRQQEENAGPLRGCVLCVSIDGTIAVIAVDGFELLYTIPGGSSPLSRIHYGGGEEHDQVLVIYADDSARLWDIKTGEFRRAMDRYKAREVVSSPGWLEIPIEEKDTKLSMSISTVSDGSVGVDSNCTFAISLERFIKFTAVDAKASSTTPVSALKTSSRSSPLTHLRTLLSTLLTLGLSPDIDEVCETKLGVISTCGGVGHSSDRTTAIYCHQNPRSPWCISGIVSASRAIAIIAILKTMSLYEEISDDCQTVITFYATSLASVVGPHFKAPDVVHLARQWFESSNELRQAARTLFDAGVARLSDEESIALVDAWQHHLPCLQPSGEKDSGHAGLALFLCGYMAAEKYSLLSTSSLIDISKSIALYLHDDGSIHRALAIDLCARGFQIWQHYVDAMAMLRALCALATSARKENITVQNVGPQARAAVLQIASSNTPLFMTTLTLDILNPKTLEHRKSIMQLVAFLIRKRPLILYPNLPRLMEAVVKSLDPNSTSSRDAVLDTATEILGHVVKTFPTIDFHMATQRLAVGTSEGAFIMYDLKTATQLFVLEGHKKRPAACSFSPDGRRLVTVSLEEGVVLVWKVGSSFTSFFNPGAPPRQGHSGSHPYKTLAFNVGDEANMTIAGTLEWVRFEWPSERSVRLHIRESTLTFSA